MDNNRYVDSDFFSAPVPADTASGAPVLLFGSLPAVCTTAEGEGGNIVGRASVKVGGVHDFAVSEAVASEGTEIYITGANVLTTTVGTTPPNALYGHTLAGPDGTGATKSAGAGTVHVRPVKA